MREKLLKLHMFRIILPSGIPATLPGMPTKEGPKKDFCKLQSGIRERVRLQSIMESVETGRVCANPFH